MTARESAVGRRREKKDRLIQLMHESSDAPSLLTCVILCSYRVLSCCVLSIVSQSGPGCSKAD